MSGGNIGLFALLVAASQWSPAGKKTQFVITSRCLSANQCVVDIWSSNRCRSKDRECLSWENATNGTSFYFCWIDRPALRWHGGSLIPTLSRCPYRRQDAIERSPRGAGFLSSLISKGWKLKRWARLSGREEKAARCCSVEARRFGDPESSWTRYSGPADGSSRVGPVAGDQAIFTARFIAGCSASIAPVEDVPRGRPGKMVRLRRAAAKSYLPLRR